MKEFAAVGTCVVVWVLLFKSWFGSKAGFVESLKYSLRPDIVSLFRGDWSKDMIEEFRLWSFICLGLGAGVLVYMKLGGEASSVPFLQKK